MKNIKQLAKELRKQLTDNILWRYDNSEYWDEDIISSYVQDNNLTYQEKDKVLKEMFMV